MKILKLKEWHWHVMVWIGIILFFSLRDLAFHPVFLEVISVKILLCSIAAIPVYINIWLLLPKFLFTKRYSLYIGMVLLITIPTGWISAYMLYENFEIPFYGMIPGKIQLTLEIILFVGLATTAKAIQQWQRKQKQFQEIEKHSLEQELQLLRNQLNPHFMFNTLNNIYVMINHTPDKARETLLRFSDLLSHQLYDSNKTEVPLELEATYLKNYIELEKVRQGDAVHVEAEIIEKSKLGIAPMLLLPIIENAFKHGFAAGLPTYQVNISLKQKESSVFFHCSNEYNPNKKGRKGGIGIQNVKKRLALLYPNQHEFNIRDNGKIFEVAIELHHLMVCKYDENKMDSIEETNKILTD